QTDMRVAPKDSDIIENPFSKEKKEFKYNGKTIPEAFILQTEVRARTCSKTFESSEIDHVKPFKARPDDPKIFESSGAIGVKKVEKRKITEPEEFKFHTDERIHKKCEEQQCSNTQKDTKKQKDITLRPTIPESPLLMTKQRAESKPKEEPIKEEIFV